MKKAAFIQLFLVLFLHTYASTKHSTNEKDYILCVNTYTDAFSWSNRVVNLLTEYTQEDPDISLSVVYMRSLMLNSDESLVAVKEYLSESSQELTPKAIVILGATALTLKEKIKEIWGEVPILYLSAFDYIGNLDAYINNRAIEEEEKIYISELQNHFNLTFIHTPLFLKENVDLLRSLYPNVAEIVLVKDQLQVNYDIENELQQVLQTNYPTISLRSITPDSLSTYDLIEHLNGLDPHKTGILFSSWSYIRNNIDGTSISTNSRELIGTCKNPIFTLNVSDITTYSGRMTGGYTYSPNELKEVIFKVLPELIHPKQGSRKTSYSFTKGLPCILYDRAERKGVDLSLLPSTTVFLNRPASFLEKNRIAISLFILLLVVALLFLLFRLRLLKVNQNALMGKQEILYQFKRQFNNMSICYSELLLSDKN